MSSLKPEPKLNKPMSELKTPFKVGETYPDGEGSQVEIVYIIPDAETPYPMVGIRRDEKGARAKSYTLSGRFMMGLPDDSRDLLPPAPPMKRVPLGPDDVPPGSVFSNTPDIGWSAVTVLHSSGIKGETDWTWGELMYRGFQIKRPGGDWQPMWKEVPDDSTNA